ncbi:putative inorganic carbon transporter subunit DabA, partial [Falsiroseomonas oryzae]|uniref:putative inorganic carbon transporter subunit DabA n=1 Tax=Falsiroseomonas oryzae TaxID=2766473 RepID=UPI0022EA1A87
MPELARLAAQIEIAAAHVTPYWPLRSFIAANPLQGLEDQPFEHAARTAAALFGGRPYPAASVLKEALADGRIDTRLLVDVARRHGRPEAARAAALDAELPPRRTPPSAVNRVMIRWLAAFLDEGQAAWPMPRREKGLWPAVRRLARHDADIPRGAEAEGLPEDALRAVAALLADVPEA